MTVKSEALNKVIPAVPTVGELKAKVDPQRVQVWERRMVNPGRESSRPVFLKDDTFVVRWVNTASEGRFHRAVYEQGWEPVEVKDLRDDPKLLGFNVTDGYVRRGNQGQEVLVKIPRVVFNRIQRRKAELNNEHIRKTRQRLQEAISGRFGDQAADWAGGNDRALDRDQAVSGLKGRILDGMETRVVESDEGDQD